MALFYSDLLFFTEPKVYLKRVENPGCDRNTFNSDVSAAYTVEPGGVCTDLAIIYNRA
jgi:hypothetical protein